VSASLAAQAARREGASLGYLGSAAEAIGACAIARIGFFENNVKLRSADLIPYPCSASLGHVLKQRLVPPLKLKGCAVSVACGFFGHSGSRRP
jgi:hypothetical protein